MKQQLRIAALAACLTIASGNAFASHASGGGADKSAEPVKVEISIWQHFACRFFGWCGQSAKSHASGGGA